MKLNFRKIIALCLICVASVIFFACDFSFEQINGKSAYEIAVDNGFVGTEQEWLASLKGTSGKDAEILTSLYGEAKNNGFDGTFYEFLAEYVKGDKGDAGSNGDTSISTAVSKGLFNVVSVYCKFSKNTGTTNGQTSTSTFSSAGSGVIYSLDKLTGDAYVITNYHVVYSAQSNTENKICDDITLYVYGNEYEGAEIPAVCIGGSLNYDIAVLKVTESDVLKNSNAKAVTLSSEKYYVGDSCVAIGNPEADGISASSGIISVDSEYIDMTGADEVTDVTFRVLRIDAPVNGGNSGGGLFNKNGELIGIVNAKTIDTEIEGMAYAIPYTVASSVADNLIRNYDGTNVSRVQKGVLGMNLKILTSISEYNQNIGKVEIKQTFNVDSISSGKLGETVGFQVGDKIVKLSYEGETIVPQRMFEVIDFILNVEVNKTLTYTVVRSGVETTIDVIFTSLETVE